jgi:rhodanese-related sulfurtransferase
VSGYRTVTPEEVAAMVERGDEVFIVDLREPREYHAGHVPDAISLPSDHFADRYGRELSPDDPVILVCERGRTSEAAAAFLVGQGFTDVATMAGGMGTWAGPTVGKGR